MELQVQTVLIRRHRQQQKQKFPRQQTLRMQKTLVLYMKLQAHHYYQGVWHIFFSKFPDLHKAQKDIADDGYWGVEQTSDRLVSMAQALSGGDTSKADTLIAAIKKGFDEATEAWGDKLPDICQKTIDAAVKKMEAWRDGTTSETDA